MYFFKQDLDRNLMVMIMYGVFVGLLIVSVGIDGVLLFYFLDKSRKEERPQTERRDLEPEEIELR